MQFIEAILDGEIETTDAIYVYVGKAAQFNLKPVKWCRFYIFMNKSSGDKVL
jgi:hypothetical protein